jgi:hypothetical protein
MKYNVEIGFLEVPLNHDSNNVKYIYFFCLPVIQKFHVSLLAIFFLKLYGKKRR